LKIRIEELSVSIQLRKNAITLDVRDHNEPFLGDYRLSLSRDGVEWCEGKTHAGNVVKKSWKELIAFFEG